MTTVASDYDHIWVPLPDMPAWNKLTQPAKREFRMGVAARKRGSPITNNPWARSIRGRSYYKFEHCWNLGWKTSDACIEAERVARDGNLGT